MYVVTGLYLVIILLRQFCFPPLIREVAATSVIRLIKKPQLRQSRSRPCLLTVFLRAPDPLVRPLINSNVIAFTRGNDHSVAIS